MFLADCHTHSSCSFDAEFPMAAMAKTAYEYGLTSLTLTDHCDLLGLEGETVLTYDWEPVLKQRKEMLDAFGARVIAEQLNELGFSLSEESFIFPEGVVCIKEYVCEFSF